jgi:hypothetical protein
MPNSVSIQASFGCSVPNLGPQDPERCERIILGSIAEVGIQFATLSRAVGVYQGETEVSIILSLVVPKDSLDETLDQVEIVAKTYNLKMMQECVLLTWNETSMAIVSDRAEA